MMSPGSLNGKTLPVTMPEASGGTKGKYGSAAKSGKAALSKKKWWRRNRLWLFALIFMVSAGLMWITLAWEELYELESQQGGTRNTVTTTTEEPCGEGGEKGISPKLSGGLYKTFFEPVTYNQAMHLDTAPAKKSGSDGYSKLCIIQSAEDAMALTSHFTAIHQIVKMFLKDDTFKKIELVIGDTHCLEDGSKGPDSSCHIKISQAFLSKLIREDYSQVEKVSVRWLKEPLVWADISRPARLSYQILEWLAKLDPVEDAEAKNSGTPFEHDACASALFLTPHLAHYSVMARSQGVGLKQTKIFTYFEHSTTSGRSTLLREDLRPNQVVEQDETMFMEATAAALADVSVIDNMALLHELDGQAREFLPKFMKMGKQQQKQTKGQRDKKGQTTPAAITGKQVYVLPFRDSKSKDTGTSKTSMKAVKFEGQFTYDNGLNSILAGLEEMHSNVTEIGEVEITFSGMDAWNSNLKYRGEQKLTQHGSDIIKDRLNELRGYKVNVITERSEVLQAKSAGGLRAIVNFAGSGGGVRRVLEAILEDAPFLAYDSTLTAFVKTIDVSDDKFLTDLKARHGIADPSHDVKSTHLAKLLWSKIKDEGSRKDCVATSSVYKIVSEHILNQKPRFVNLYKKELAQDQESNSAAKGKDPSAVQVSIVLIHHNRPDMVQQAMASIHYQSQKKVEVILLDNASTHPGTQAALDSVAAKYPSVQIVYLDEVVSLSAARNLGASKATGEYILFMDDDNIAKPREVEIMVMAALNTGADVVSPGNQYFVGETSPYQDEKNAIKAINKWMPLGASAPLGMFRDVFGDSNALFKKSTFHRYDGFQEHKDIDSSWEGEMAKATGEDWELMARMTLGGENLQVVPISLFWYRLSPDAFSKSSSRSLYLQKVLSPYTNAIQKYSDSMPELSFVGPLMKFAQYSYHKESMNTPKNVVSGLDKLLNMVRTKTVNSFDQQCSLDQNDEYDESRNLLKNSNFKELGVEEAHHWETFGKGYEASRYIEGLKMSSTSIADSYGARQTISLKERSDRPIFIAAQTTQMEGTSANPTQSGGYSIYVDLEYEDKSMGYGYVVKFSKPRPKGEISENNANKMLGVKRWKCGLIIPSKPVERIHFHLLFRNQVGVVVFHKGIVRHLEYNDVCRAYVHNPLRDATNAALPRMNNNTSLPSSNSTLGSNESNGNATEPVRENLTLVDCEGHFTSETPILM